MHGFSHAEQQVPKWPEDHCARLFQLNGEGLSSADIAKKLNREFGSCYSRNAVIGKRLRSGLTTPARDTMTPEQRAARRKKASESQRGRWQRIRIDATPLEYMDAPTIEDMAIQFAQRETIMGLTRKNCHWPVGDPSSADFFFCGGVAVKDRPYCAGHCKVAYGKSVSPNPKSFRLPKWGTTV